MALPTNDAKGEYNSLTIIVFQDLEYQEHLSVMEGFLKSEDGRIDKKIQYET